METNFTPDQVYYEELGGIITAANLILEQVGFDRETESTGNMDGVSTCAALVGLGETNLTEVYGEALSFIAVVRKTCNNNPDISQIGITYDVRDPNLSRYIQLNVADGSKPNAVMMYYNSKPTKTLNPIEARIVCNDLSRMANIWPQ